MGKPGHVRRPVWLVPGAASVLVFALLAIGPAQAAAGAGGAAPDASALVTAAGPPLVGDADPGRLPDARLSAGASGYLEGVSAVSSGDVWAVGYSRSASGKVSTLAEHWNGRRWTIVPSPDPSGAAVSVLDGVAAVSAGDAWAIGYSATGPASATSTLAEHWNGHRWAQVPSPNP